MNDEEPVDALSPNSLRQAAEPDELRAALGDAEADMQMSEHEHPAADAASVRQVNYRGHAIVIETRYTITVDGNLFEAPVSVDVDGRVHYHGLPTRDFASVVTLVERAIDQFSDDFPVPGESPGRDESEPDHNHGHRS